MQIGRKVSIGIPVHNEESVIGELLARLGTVLSALPAGPHEIVFVDDGSTDRTVELLRDAKVANATVVVVRLSRNFGHQAALTAALDHVTGEVAVLMDGDLQDAPEAIPQMLEKHAEGYDVVFAQRASRHEPWYLRLSYGLFYRLIQRLADVKLPLDSGDFSLLSRKVVDTIKRAPERHRYLRGLRSWAGFRQIGVTVARDARFAGESKYSALKLMNLAFDGIFSFSIVPLRLASILGALVTTTAGAYALYALMVKLMTDRAPLGFTALVVVVVFMSGVQLLFLGIIGEYVGRAYDEAKARPHYVVDEIIRGS
jgi:dolichol-phosphate mannosyltransferase